MALYFLIFSGVFAGIWAKEPVRIPAYKKTANKFFIMGMIYLGNFLKGVVL